MSGNCRSGTDISKTYNSFIRRKWLILGLLLIILCGAAVLSVCIGSGGLSVPEVLDTVFGGGTKQTQAIIWNIRMPKVVTAVVVGIALAMSGCVMQCVLRNPLASASTLGVSQGASFGAAFAIVYLDAGVQVNSSSSAAVAVTNPVLVTICAFLGGILTTAVILGLSRIGQVTPATMVLAGVALSSLFGGATTIVQYFADDVKIASVVYWTFGDLGRTGWKEIALIFSVSTVCFLVFMYNRWNYNAMESGIQTAKSLGVRVDGLMLLSMTLCSLAAAVSVAFVGVIGFIGLIAPHMVRGFVGNDYRFLIPASAMTGAIILLFAELVSRTAVSPSILPIGALTSFLGAPLFIYMVFKRGNMR